MSQKRVSPEEHKRRGTYRRDRCQTDDVPASRMPRKPAWLIGQAGRLWTRLAFMQRERGLLDETSAITFSVWCCEAGRWIEATKHLTEQGEMLRTPDGRSYPNPWARVKTEAEKTVVSLAGEFGLTPAALTRLGLRMDSGTEADADDRAARFFRTVG